MDNPDYNGLLEAFRARPGWKPLPGYEMARCPVHEDGRPSLKLTEKDDRVLLVCFAGCPTESIVAALGYPMSAMFRESNDRNGRVTLSVTAPTSESKTVGSTTYVAWTPDMKVKAEHTRHDKAGGGKSFTWNMPEGIHVTDLMPYASERLPDTGMVVVAEGEKATDALIAMGYNAVGTYGAMAIPKREALVKLQAREVVLWPDNDPAGDKWTEKMSEVLLPVAAPLRVVRPPTGYPSGWDAADASMAEAEPFIRDARAVDSYHYHILETRTYTPEDVVDIPWLWPGWMQRGSITLLDGNPGEGKSTAVCSLIASFTMGSALPNGWVPPEAIRVMYATVEDDPTNVIVPRLMAAGASRTAISRVDFVSRPDKLDLQTSIRDIGDTLIKATKSGDPYGLILLDPLFSFVGKARTIADTEMRAVLTPLTVMAREQDVAVLAIRHFSKDTKAGTLLRGAGSLGGIVGMARAVWTIVADKTDEENKRRVFAATKVNAAPLPHPLAFTLVTRRFRGDPSVPMLTIGYDPDFTGAAEWHGEADMDADELLAMDRDEARRIDPCADMLVDILTAAGGSLPQKDVLSKMKSAGFPTATVYRARQRAKVYARRSGFGAAMKSVWSLSPTVSTASTTPSATPLLRPDDVGDSDVGATEPSPPIGGEPVRKSELEPPLLRVVTTEPEHVTCADYRAHQSSHVRRKTGWVCLVCEAASEAG